MQAKLENLLKIVASAGPARRNVAKRSNNQRLARRASEASQTGEEAELTAVNEHSEPVFNAASRAKPAADIK
ncbi:hypothetical protein D3879_01930 [Pseudomonas cavernicola]|uniref:Uncharacterized protein n=1 Tax=Pseudomonas cavernicola TaxID=2320866 RepID=A0A418XI37_9PSED|nr:hypothetical protein D3879_01930 [Pseudomonas cavernicola]